VVTVRRLLVTLLGVASVTAVLVSDVSSYVVRLSTAVVAVVVLLRHANAPGRVSRLLLASALLMGILSGVLATAYLLQTGQPSPPGAAADWAYLTYGPLAVAGLLTLPRHPDLGPWRLKACAEALIVVTSLGFLLERVFADMMRDSGQPLQARLAAVGYPLNGMFVLAVLLTVVSRLQPELQPFLRRCGLGLALLMAGDIGYAVGLLHGWYHPTTWPAVLTQAGLVLIALSPVAARRELRLEEPDLGPPSLVDVGAPYLAVVPSICFSSYLIITGKPFTRGEMLLAVVVGTCLVARQLLSNAEHRHVVEALTGREREAKAAALRDPLTLLSNRTAVHTRLKQHLTRGDRVTLALLDLDDFKDINDTHGHAAGDAVLAEFARRLRAEIREVDFAFRQGGEEFVVLLPETDAYGGAIVAERLGAAIRDIPVPIDARRTDAVTGQPVDRIRVSVSIGVAVYPEHGVTAEQVLQAADDALYAAKNAGRDTYRLAEVVSPVVGDGHLDQARAAPGGPQPPRQARGR